VAVFADFALLPTALAQSSVLHHSALFARSSTGSAFATSGRFSPEGGSSIGAIIGGIVGAVAILAGGCAGLAWFWFRRRRFSASEQSSDGDQADGGYNTTLLTDVEEITCDATGAGVPSRILSTTSTLFVGIATEEFSLA
jgi:hypothetical protein